MENNISTKKALAEGAFSTSIASFALRGVGFLTSVILLKELSLYQFGVMELTSSIFSFLGIFLLPGINNVAISEVSYELGVGNKNKARAIVKNYFKLQYVFVFIAWAIFFFGANIIGRYYNLEISNSLKIISFIFLLSPIRSFLNLIYLSNFKFLLKNIYGVMEDAVKLVIIFFIFFILRSIRVDNVFFSTVTSQIISFFIMIPSAYRIWRQNFGSGSYEKIPLFSMILKNGKWGILSTYMNNFGQNIRLWIIKFTLGIEAVGLFSFAFTLFGHTMSLVAISNVLNPIFSKLKSDTVKFMKLIDKSIKYQFIAYLALLIIALTTFPTIIDYFFPKYHDSLFLFKILMISIIPASFANIFTPLFYSLNAQKSLFNSIMIKNFFIAFFSIIFIHLFGIVGVAIEYLATVTVYSFERYLKLKKIIPNFSISIRNLFRIDIHDRVILDSILRKFKFLSKNPN
ncbi:MAG: hypothetical protein EXS49_01640 [Candidatus Pacebacteria bacterium]|nr:hypothetical protein [Candidatus Paceibacterota bacterium]